MARWKKFEIPLSSYDVLDVKLKIERNTVVDFSLNYRIKIGARFFEVYRVDTAHGYLHEQRFWLTPAPIPVPSMDRKLNDVFNAYLDRIKENYKRYRKYYADKRKKGG